MKTRMGNKEINQKTPHEALMKTRMGNKVVILREKAPQFLTQLYNKIWQPYYTGDPREAVFGPLGRQAIFLFDRTKMFEPTTGRLVRVPLHNVTPALLTRVKAVQRDPTITRIASMLGATGRDKEPGWFRTAGRIATAAGGGGVIIRGVTIIGTGGPIGWVVGGGLVVLGLGGVIGGFYGAYSDIKSELGGKEGNKEPSTSGQESDITVTEEEADEDFEHADDTEDEQETGDEQESDIIFTEEEADEDFEHAGEGGMPGPDDPVPGIIYINGRILPIGPGPYARDPRDTEMPAPDGPVGPGPAARGWIVAPLYLATPGSDLKSFQGQVAGFVSFAPIR